MTYTLGDLADHVKGVLVGNADCPIHNVASLQNAKEGDIAFISGKEYLPQLHETSASAVVLSDAYKEACPVDYIACSNPHLAFTKIARILNPPPAVKQGVHASACIAESAVVHETASIAANVIIEDNVEIGREAIIGAGCVIGADSFIGDESCLVANVTICHKVTIGSKVIIHPGAVIGADGFGLSRDNDTWLKVPQLGSVRIGNNVEIGANTTIDRGALEDTVIGDGVKIDNQVQIAHNVTIGNNTAIAGCVGIAGSASIGSGCTIGGGTGIVGHLEIVNDTHVTAMSLVTRSLTTPGVYSSGTPLQENREWHRNFVRFRQLDDMAKRLKSLEKKLALLEKE